MSRFVKMPHGEIIESATGAVMTETILKTPEGVWVDTDSGEVVEVIEVQAEVQTADAYDPIASGDLSRWYMMAAEAKRLRDEEMALRKKIVAALFPKTGLWEGTENYRLEDGAIVKGKGKINREVDPAILLVMSPSFRENDINIDQLIRYKPELSVTEYRKLTDAQRIMFDQVLTIKQGSPELEIVVPKVKS